mgnify:FL=1
MFTFTNFILIGFTAAIGAWLRWGTTSILAIFYPSLPLGTLLVNIVGGFIMGLSYAAFQSSAVDFSEDVRVVLNIGFLGSLTTFSAYSADILNLFHKGEIFMGITFILANALGVLLFSYLGWYLFNLFLE